MKKVLLLLITLTILSCESNSIKQDDMSVVLTEEEKLKELFITTIKPLFKEYNADIIPKDFRIIEKDNSVNAGAADNYLEVSNGLVNYKKKYIQVFVLAHEISHIVTLSQAKSFMLPIAIPSGIVTNDYKKAEYLADLIAIHLINVQEHELSKELQSNFDELKGLLGSETFTHPRAEDRINLMKNYLSKEKIDNSSEAFRKSFEEIWRML